MKRSVLIAGLVVGALAVLAEPMLAQRRGFRGGGGHFAGRGTYFSRAGAVPSVTRGIGWSNAGSRWNGGDVIDRPIRRPGFGANWNLVDRPVNIWDADVSIGGWNRWNSYYGCCYYRPIARAAAWYGSGWMASNPVGSTFYALPSSCTSVVVAGYTYYDCDGTWYQPQFAGFETVYVVVAPPR